MEDWKEELAVRIRDGELGLMPELWRQVYGFIFQRATAFYHGFKLDHGVVRFDVEDLVQQAYFALDAAVRCFDPAKGSFLTVLGLTLKTAFAEVAGVRSSKRDAILFADSGDQPVNDEGDVTLFETVEDPRQKIENYLEDPERAAQLEELHKTLENCLGRLPEDQSDVLRRYYYQGRSHEAIGAELGVSGECIRQKRNRALDQIREERFTNGLIAFLDANTNFYQKSSLGRFRSTGESIVETIVFQRERKAQRWIKNYEKAMRRIHRGKDTDPGRDEGDLSSQSPPG